MLIKKNLLFTLLLTLLAVSCSSSKIAQLTPDEKKAKIYYSHGTAALISKDYTKALDLLIKAKALSPDNPKIYNNLAMAYYFKKHKQNAKKYLKKTLELEPNNADARNNLASMYFKQKKYTMAEKEYKKVLKNLTYPNQYRTYYNLALIDMKQDKSDDALLKLKQSIAENKDYCASHFLLGQIYEKGYEYQKAFKSYKNARLGMCVKYPAPLLRSAIVLMDMQKYSKAEKLLLDLIHSHENTAESAKAKKLLRNLSKIIVFNTKKRNNMIKQNNEKNNNSEQYSINTKQNIFKSPKF